MPRGEITRRALMAGGVAFAAIGAASPAVAQVVYTPPRGAPERTAILDVVRAAVGEGLQIQRPGLVVSRMSVIEDAFAYVVAQPLTPDGAPIDYATTPFAEDYAAGLYDDVVMVFLTYADGAWTVAEIDFGPTDWLAPSWADAYGAPRALVEG